MEASRQWDDIFNMLRKKTANQEFYNKQNYNNEGKIKTFSNKLIEFISSHPSKEILPEEILQAEMKGH